MFRRIVVGVDGSEQSLRAVDTATELARRFEGMLMLVCVYRHHSPLEASVSTVRSTRGSAAESAEAAMKAYARDVIARARDQVDEAIPVEAFILRGPTAREIVDFARKKEADAIVVGARGAGDVSGFLLGSVSHKVGGLSPVTCVLVK
ncbi:MAG: universal stress protein [Rubrimonas sp.]